MAELLVKAVSATHSDPAKDQRGCYKRGHAVVVMPDGHEWGTLETLPRFVVLKFPLVAPARVEKYLATVTTRRRRWRLRWADLPAAARNKLTSTGQLVIKADAAYTGAFDYTWAQVKGFFRDDETNTDETGGI